MLRTSDLYLRRHRTRGASNRAPSSNPCHTVLRDGLWEGRRCFIVGGGPSLAGFDWSRLRGELTIGINRAFEFFDPTIIFSMDCRFWRWVEEGRFGEAVRSKWIGYDRGFKVMLQTGRWPMPTDILTLADDVGHRFSDSLAEGVGNGSNSGFAALNLATCLGASPIYLLGYDMHGNRQGGQAWFHSGYPQRQKESVYARFLQHFERNAEDIRRRARIVNLNPASGLRCFEFGRIEDVPIIRRSVVVSFYTLGNGYEAEAQRLRRSCLKLGLEHDIIGVQSLGDWEANCAHKPRFLLETMDRHPGRDLLWVDADGAVIRYPSLFDRQDGNDPMAGADIAVHYRAMGNRPEELLSGTVWVSGGERGRRVVEAWAAQCAMHPGVWDQKVLSHVLDSAGGDVHVRRLPAEYCAIFDQGMAVEPVIEHYQASRRLKQR